MKYIIKNLLTKKNPEPDAFIDKFYQIVKELTPVLLRQFQKHLLTRSMESPLS